MPQDLFTKNLIEIGYWLIVAIMWICYVFWILKTCKTKAKALTPEDKKVDSDAIIGATQSAIIKFVIVAALITAVSIGLWVGKQSLFASPISEYDEQGEARIERDKKKEPTSIKNAKSAVDKKQESQDKKHQDALDKATDFFNKTKNNTIEEATTRPKGQ